MNPITRVGLVGAAAAYLAFAPKTAQAVVDPDPIVITVRADDRVIVINEQNRVISIHAEDRVITAGPRT